jgi:hypothetical protein
VTITPRPSAVLVGSSTAFSAAVVNTSNMAVNWTATGGSPQSASTASFTWTAPASAGTFTIMAASVADPSASDTVSIAVKGKDLGTGETNVSTMAMLSKAYGSRSGDAAYLVAADLNGDGVIDDQDITIWLSVF